MFRPCLILLCGGILLAQTPADLFQKAPPAVDEALRARITKFYQLHVDQKFRQAEAMVAEECKDFFYSVNKPNYLSFEIRDIIWSDNFTKAKATVLAQMRVMLPGFADKPMPVPFPSMWKLVNNEWYWYVNLDEVHQTPFGKMKSGTSGGGGITRPAMPSADEMAKALQQVKVDKPVMELKAGAASSGEFVITNEMPGAVKLFMEPLPAKVPGFQATLGKSELKAGEKSSVKVEWMPGSRPAPGAVSVTVWVQPTNQSIPLRVNFVK